MKCFFLLVSLTIVTIAAERGQEIPLWSKGAPGSENVTAPELSKPSVDPKNSNLPGNYTATHNPAIYVFLPPADKATGAAMIVAPGGGHRQLVMEKEGWEVADWLNSHGIAAFVLKYRLAKSPQAIAKYSLPGEVYADAARSVRLVRSRAKEWNVDPARIGFIGFSAGGEVAGMIGTKFDAGKPDDSDPIERVSSRPDFNILIYPWYRPGAPGIPPQGDQTQAFPIPANAPPVFMVCTDDDRSHVEPTVKFYMELEAAKIPTEMHIFAYGGHGFGLRPTQKPAPVMKWPALMLDWMTERGILKSNGSTASQ